MNSFYGTWDIDVSPATNTLVVGGEFTNFNGVNTHGVALLPPGSSDAVAPTAPGTPSVTASSGTSLTLSWSPGTDNQGVAGYRVLRNGIEVAYPSTTTFTDTFLAPSTDYSYAIQTVDAAGNLSPPTPTIIGRTGLVLLTPGSTWRYLDTGVEPGAPPGAPEPSTTRPGRPARPSSAMATVTRPRSSASGPTRTTSTRPPTSVSSSTSPTRPISARSPYDWCATTEPSCT